MNIINFKASVISASKNQTDKYYMVGFADDKYDYTHYVMLQKAFKYDEDDIRNGMDGHYFEVDGQQNAAYKGCLKMDLHENSILFTLDPSKINGIQQVHIDITGIKLSKKVLKYLKEIFS